MSLTPLYGKTHGGCNTFSGKDHGIRQTHTPRGAVDEIKDPMEDRGVNESKLGERLW